MALEYAFAAGSSDITTVNITGGHDANDIAGGDANIVSGGGNAANPNKLLQSTDYRTISGGYDNQIDGAIASTISGGAHHRVQSGSSHATIGGGSYNTITAGDYCAIAGGTGNEITATQGTISGGINNKAGEAAAVGGGSTNVASGRYAAIAGGTLLTASGEGSFAAGNGNTVAGYYAHASGYQTVASADYTTVSGRQAKAYLRGQRAHANGCFAAAGDAQISDLVLRRQTTDATESDMLLDGGGVYPVVPEKTVWFFEIFTVGVRTDAEGEYASFKHSGILRRNSGGLAIVGGLATPGQAHEMKNWYSRITVNTSSNALRVIVRGEANKTIRWVSRIELVEVVTP